MAEGKDIARFTALMQREDDLPVPEGTPGHPPPAAPKPVGESPVVAMSFGGGRFGYADLVENRLAEGQFFNGPCAVWFRMNHPLVKGEEPSPYQRAAVAADSGNGISAALDFTQVPVRQLRPDRQPHPPSGRRMDLPAVAQPVRRQRLRACGFGALRRAGPYRARDAKPRRAAEVSGPGL